MKHTSPSCIRNACFSLPTSLTATSSNGSLPGLSVSYWIIVFAHSGLLCYKKIKYKYVYEFRPVARKSLCLLCFWFIVADISSLVSEWNLAFTTIESILMTFGTKADNLHGSDNQAKELWSRCVSKASKRIAGEVVYITWQSSKRALYLNRLFAFGRISASLKAKSFIPCL